MTTWAERAKTHFLQKAQECTPITPETSVMGVLGAAPRRILENAHGVLGVLGVGDCPILKKEPASDTRLEDSLLTTAMRACDHHGDGDIARQDMRQQCLDTPPYLRGDLLDHFNQTYGKKS